MTKKGCKPPNLKDETGKKYGFLRVLCRSISPYPNNGISTREKRAYWWCLCTRCYKNIVRTSGKHLRSGHTISCGCYGKDARASADRSKDLKGKKFGKLTAVEKTDKKFPGSNCVVWRCECDCGNKKVYVLSTNLIHKRKTSCGCEFSKGETKIQDVLENLEIDFIKNKTFEDCRNPDTNRLLKFDFYLPEYNCCIEYDGEQHFKEVSIFKESLENNQHRDTIKNNYCKEHNIKLIRIPYWKKNDVNEEFILERISKNDS